MSCYRSRRQEGMKDAKRRRETIYAAFKTDLRAPNSRAGRVVSVVKEQRESWRRRKVRGVEASVKRSRLQRLQRIPGTAQQPGAVAMTCRSLARRQPQGSPATFDHQPHTADMCPEVAKSVHLGVNMPSPFPLCARSFVSTTTRFLPALAFPTSRLIPIRHSPGYLTDGSSQ